MLPVCLNNSTHTIIHRVPSTLQPLKPIFAGDDFPLGRLLGSSLSHQYKTHFWFRLNSFPSWQEVIWRCNRCQVCTVTRKSSSQGECKFSTFSICQVEKISRQNNEHHTVEGMKLEETVAPCAHKVTVRLGIPLLTIERNLWDRAQRNQKLERCELERNRMKHPIGLISKRWEICQSTAPLSYITTYFWWSTNYCKRQVTTFSSSRADFVDLRIRIVLLVVLGLFMRNEYRLFFFVEFSNVSRLVFFMTLSFVFIACALA